MVCLCGLTFELSGSQRRDARPGLWKMPRTTDRAWWLAVGAPLERGVRQQGGARDSSRDWRRKIFALHKLGRHDVYPEFCLQHSWTIARVCSGGNGLAAVSGVRFCSRRHIAGAAC